jgi:hypothetical protein
MRQEYSETAERPDCTTGELRSSQMMEQAKPVEADNTAVYVGDLE